MFTGIVQGTATVLEVSRTDSAARLRLAYPAGAMSGLQRGGSVSAAGVCLTAVQIEGDEVEYDVIDETLARTTLGGLTSGARVNFERAARMGDEVGGHVISGHVWGRGIVQAVERTPDNCALTIEAPDDVMVYVFEKGFIGVDGVSLTIGATETTKRTFRLHLIPETLEITTLGALTVGSEVNLEVDPMTQAVVETVRRVMAARGAA